MYATVAVVRSVFMDGVVNVEVEAEERLSFVRMILEVWGDFSDGKWVDLCGGSVVEKDGHKVRANKPRRFVAVLLVPALATTPITNVPS